MQPTPEVLADLRGSYPRVTERDLIACWQNASRLWRAVPAPVLANEPPELTAARALFVHSQFQDFAEDRANASFAMWTLIVPYEAQRK